MARYVVTRLASAVVALFVITVFVFVSFNVLPKQSQRQTFTTSYRIHGSLPHQYGVFVWNLVRHGDLGRSYADREPVTDRIGRAAPVTISLALGGVAVLLYGLIWEAR